MHPITIFTTDIAEAWRKIGGLNARIAETAKAIVRQLRCEGECKVIWFGKVLEFELNINTCDIFVDGEYVDSIYHYSLIREFLEDIAECEVCA